jgi:hypothetical protein
MKKIILGTIVFFTTILSFSQNSAESNTGKYEIKRNVNFSESTSSYYKIFREENFSSEGEVIQFSISDKKINSPESQSNYFNISKTQSISNKNQKSTAIIESLPVSEFTNKNTYALIIGNEDYKSHQPSLNYEQNVEFAINDAKLFRELCNKTLGVPNENIIYVENATYAKTKQSIEQIELICKHTTTKPTILFYYSGHGLPEESTRIPHIIPVDVSGSNLNFGISLPELYKSLTKYPVEKAIVVLDACFTGDARNSGLVSSRAVRLRPKANELNSRIVVFSSSSSDQPSKSYKEKEYGLFTYYLSQKIIESKGNVTLGELDEYLVENVPVRSVLINKTEQVPQTNVSNEIVNEWKNWTLK